MASSAISGINETDSSGRSALHMACNGGYLPMAQLLAQQGADLTAVDMDGDNALIYTCLGSGDLSTVTWLLDQGLDVNHTNKQGATAYHIAAGNGHVSVLKKLKEKGANIQAEDISGDNALIRACAFSEDISTVQCLIDQGVNVTHTNKIGFTAFHYAAQNGQPEMMKCLYRRDPTLRNRLSAERITPLMLACQYGHTETVSTWLHLGSDKDEKILERKMAQDKDGHGKTEQLLQTDKSPAPAEKEPKDHQEVTVKARDDNQINTMSASSACFDGCHVNAQAIASANQDGDITKRRRLLPPNTVNLSMQTHSSADPDGVIANRRRLLAPNTLSTSMQTHSKYLAKINLDHLTMDRNNILGKGNYGDVYRGKLLVTDVAVKEVALKSRKRNIAPLSISDEIEVSASVRHPNIVSFMGYAYDLQPRSKCLLLVYELIDGHNLEDIIYEDGLMEVYNLTLEKKYNVLHQISKALAHLHGQEHRIIHGDIKPSNMMLTKEGIAKLCDLGLSKIKQNRTVSIKTTLMARGTPIYMAPEQLIKGKSSSIRSDVYSFGASIYEVIFENYLWDLDDGDDNREYDCKRLKEKVEAEKVPHKLHKEKDHSSYNLIAMCVQFEHENRPEVIALVQELEKLAQKK